MTTKSCFITKTNLIKEIVTTMIYLKKLRITVLIMILFSAIPVGGEESDANKILATVNGESITLAHVIAAVARLPQEYNNLEPDYLLDGILNQIVKQEVMAQTLDISDEKTKAFMANEIRSIKAKYAIEEKMRGFPTSEMIEIAYDKVTSSLNDVEEFNASHILLDSEKSAIAVIELFKSGKGFEELAKTKSTGPSATNGGQLGWFGLGQMVPEFETAVMVLEVGTISQPVKTQFGWHVIKLNDRRIKPLPTIEELKPELIQKLSEERIDVLVMDQTNMSSVKFLDNLIDPSAIRNLELLQ